MTKRGPTDTDRQNGEGDVEVVNATGERKPASFPQRIGAKVRDVLNTADEQPTWLPGELAADDDPQIAAAGYIAEDDEQTIVTGNPAVVSEQPPQATLVAYRRQHADNVQRVADQTMRHASQMVEMDKHARDRVFDIGHRTALLALCNEAAAQLANDGWALVTPQLIAEFAAEIDGWRADRGIA